MKNLLAALLLLIGLASPAEAAFDVTQNTSIDSFADGTAYDGSATGIGVWGNPSGMTCAFCTGQGTTKSFHIVTTGNDGTNCVTKWGHKCIEFEYPSGGLGATPGLAGYGTLTMDLNMPFFAGMVNMEYDYMLETGYDLHSIGKIAPTLRWLATTSAGSKTQHATTNWQCASGISQPSCNTFSTFVTYYQNDATGGHQGCTSISLGNTIQTNVWYHVKSSVDMSNTSAPLVIVYINGPGVGNGVTPVQVFNCTSSVSNATVLTNVVQWSYGGWFGGGGNNDRALNNSYQLVANSHFYTGTGGSNPGTPPTVPAGLVATLTQIPPQNADTQITEQWSASTAAGTATVSTYTLQHNDNGGAYSTINATNATNFIDIGLTTGHTYCYKVNAIDNFGNTSAFSTPVCMLAQDVTAPTVPTNFSGHPTSGFDTKITINWSASFNQLGNPIVYHEWLNGVDTKQTTGLGDNLTGLTPSTTYSLNLSACDQASNCSAQTSPTITVTTTLTNPGTPPSVPTGFVLSSVAPTQADVRWNASTSGAGVDHYSVFLDSGGGPVLQGQTVSPLWSFANLVPSTAYNVTVTATDSFGNTSAASSQFPFTTTATSTLLIFQMNPGTILNPR